ncbi:MAG: glycerol-3-phosphate 1-O-acyltransferase PlsY [Candidatus Bipolaricaulia bacterium]
MALAAALIVAYLIGAFPSSVVFGRVFRGIDVRQHGSGNAGATNAWRVLGWRLGVAVLATDIAKGAAATAAVSRIPFGPTPVDTQTLAALCGIVAVVGHVFPVYIRFRGGKGVATAAGMLIALLPIPVGIGIGVFAAAAIASGWISLGSLLGAWAVPVATLFHPGSLPYPPLFIALTFVLAAFITYTHRGNIRRIVAGTERSFPSLQFWRKRP